MTAYYNDFDASACAWLEELIRRGLIADGIVDNRSILDVEPADLVGFTQCHFFAGIGGWSYALRLAGWPDDKPVWTGSPPCQPFSAAGRQLGKDDERHLAPHFIGLVRACRPAMLFGEQVASAAVFGKAAKHSGKQAAIAPDWAWLDDLSDRLEAAQYAVGAADIPAASVGAPHIRQRTFFGAVRLADTERKQCEERISRRPEGLRAEGRGEAKQPPRFCVPDRLADTDDTGSQGWVSGRPDAGRQDIFGYAGCGGATVGMADAQHNDGRADVTQRGPEGGALDGRRSAGLRMAGERGTNADHGGWGNPDWLFCRDAKWRPVEPGTFPLAHGVSARVGRLRGYGNAIVPQAAATFIEAFTEANVDFRLGDIFS